MLNICILDAKTLGTDVNMDILKSWGRVTVFPVTYPEEVVKRITNQDVIITNKVILNESNLKFAPAVKLICVAATGVNNIDLDYARHRGIAVTNVAGYSTASVIQHTFAMLFYLLQSMPYYDNYVKSGKYAHNQIFTHISRPFWQLNQKTWGIIGLGAIGRGVASIAQSFGCQVVYYSTSGRNNNKDYVRLELDELLSCSDVISIHAPLNQNTNNLITYSELDQMRKSVIILNLGRGGIINETDLARALDDGLIAGAGLDVLEHEPINEDNPLLKIKNNHRLLITPHIAWTSIEARKKLLEEIALNIKAFVQGERRNRLD